LVTFTTLATLTSLASAQLNIQARARGYRVATQPIQPQPRPRPVPIEDESPKPFSFSYNNADEFGTQWTREESGDANGVVRGSYSYRDASGQYRVVTYVADADGFRAVVDSNEPGLVPHEPANVVYNVVKRRR